MKVEVLMPKMGESITEGRILKWLKQPGDAIDRDENILEIATDKVDTEVPAPNAGILVKVMAEEGATVEVGVPIAIIETDADAAEVEHETSSPPASAEEAEKGEQKQTTSGKQETPSADSPQAPSPAAPAESTTADAATAADNDGPRFYSPVVMRIASTEGVSMQELESIPGSGAGGRVSKKDILGYLEKRESGAISAATPGKKSAAEADAAMWNDALASRPAPSATADQSSEIIPMSNMQRLMAEHMVRSVQTSPHVAVVSDVDLTNIVRFRDKHASAFKEREGLSLTYMPFIAEATIRTLKDFPLVNSSIDGENIIMKKMINLGIAVAMDDGGLIVPIVKHADTLNVVGLARAITDVATRARHRKLQPEEIQDGTFTITNFGVFGNIFGTPIINQPQVAILGVGAVRKTPVVIEHDGEESIAIRSMMYVSMSFDHRIIDGALGGRFVERIKHYLEGFNPDSI
ncbi:MAG: 2-oxo acid dehydrogenase subunit E2 [Bacteroidetes bacterium]|nr:2-oxo acid dehydrogenase subunit E2 [Bacteroidota bacterium]